MFATLKRPSLGGTLSCIHLTIWSLAYASSAFWPESLPNIDWFFYSLFTVLTFPVATVVDLFSTTNPDALEYFYGLSALMLHSFVSGHLLAYVIKRIAAKRLDLNKKGEQDNPSS